MNIATTKTQAKTQVKTNVDAIAAEVLATVGSGGSIPPFTSRQAGAAGSLTLDDAYRVLPLLRAGFEKRGEKIAGRKIGFTNRILWEQYGVYAPIWGYATDRTVHDLEPGGILPLATLSEPRIEPEIMFGLAKPPAPDMDDAALLGCLDWVALGYEIVQSIYPSWKFSAPDTVAANGLHGALLIGERHPVAPRRGEWLRTLPAFEIALECDGRVMDRGGGACVLEGPLSTLRLLARLLDKDPHNPPLAAGEIISSGTLTKALVVKPGETWTARPSGIALAPISLAFTA